MNPHDHHDFVIENTSSNNEVTGKIDVPKKLKRFFKTNRFFAKYDTDIHVDSSIYNIPLLAAILPFAWITGSDVKIDSLDRRFKESMENLQKEFKKAYPLGPFNTEIKADKIVENKTGTIGTGLLFSGGVDSTYSLYKNLKSNPRLLMIWGVDDFAYPENQAQWDYIYSTYSKQAKKLGLPINLIKTNISQILNSNRINHAYHRILYNGSFRSLIQHSMILLPLMAPLSIKRFNRLLIASSTSQDRDFSKLPWGSSPIIDEQIVWANLNVKHDGAIYRTKKIFEMKEFLKDGMVLRVCLRKLDRDELNDNKCEKCYRTLLTLILAGIDPNKCGFSVDEDTFLRIQKDFSQRMNQSIIETYLEPIQKMIPPDFSYPTEGAYEFFQWFKTHKFKTVGDLEPLRVLYYSLPYQIAVTLDAFYRKLGFHIHQPTTHRN